MAEFNWIGRRKPCFAFNVGKRLKICLKSRVQSRKSWEATASAQWRDDETLASLRHRDANVQLYHRHAKEIREIPEIGIHRAGEHGRGSGIDAADKGFDQALSCGAIIAAHSSAVRSAGSLTRPQAEWLCSPDLMNVDPASGVMAMISGSA